MKSVRIYGVKNCSTVQKAISWLKEKEVDFDFIDYNINGVQREYLEKVCAKFGWQNVLNKKGLMWKKSPLEMREKVIDENTAIDYLMQIPRAIKRPILDLDENYILGFDEEIYLDLIKNL